MKANANRHSLVVFSDVVWNLYAGSTLVLSATENGTSYRPYVVKYEDIGDMLYRIDTFLFPGSVVAALIETYNEDRPTEQP